MLLTHVLLNLRHKQESQGLTSLGMLCVYSVAITANSLGDTKKYGMHFLVFVCPYLACDSNVSKLSCIAYEESLLSR